MIESRMIAAPRKPSLFRVLWLDYTAFMALALPAALWVVTAIWVTPWSRDSGVVSPLGRQALLISSVIVAILGATLAAWRYINVRRLFRDGVETTGILARVDFFGDRGRLEYDYTVEGQPHRSGAVLHRDLRVRLMQVGQAVVLIVDARNPRRAVIRDLYL